MPRVVVTGGTGFVGANLVRRLAADSHDVHLLVRPAYNDWRLEGVLDNLHLHVVNLARAEDLQETLRRISPEWVFHLAVYGAYPFQGDARTMVQTNVLGTLNLVEASVGAGAEVVVNTGSSSEYGFKDGPTTESDSAEPNSVYGVTKLAATLLCRDLALRSGVRVPTLRLYSVYGPYEEPTRLIPRLFVRGLDGGLPPLADPHTSHDFVFVDDVVDAYLRSAAQHTTVDAIFNVGTGVQTPISSVVDTVRALLHIAEEPQWGTFPDRAWDTHTWVSDSTKIRTELGWSPRFMLADGLRRTLAWFRERPDYLQRYRQTRLWGRP